MSPVRLSTEQILTDADFEVRVEMASGSRRPDAISLAHKGTLVARLTRRRVERLRDLLDLALQWKP